VYEEEEKDPKMLHDLINGKTRGGTRAILRLNNSRKNTTRTKDDSYQARLARRSS